MNKAELVSAMAEQTGLSKKDFEKAKLTFYDYYISLSPITKKLISQK